MPVGSKDPLKKFLSDVYSIEQQALAQMRVAPELAGDATLSRHFQEHLVETERQAEMVKERLEAVGGSPSRVKDAVMRLGGKGFLLFAGSQPDTPGKLVAHAHSYEALEFAAYDMLERMAHRAGDEETARVAKTIRAQEAAMRDRLASDFDIAVDASLRKIGKEPADTLDHYLADAHALEVQAIELLKKGPRIAGDPVLAEIYEHHLEESKEHARLVESRLDAMGSSTSVVKDAALRAGAVNWALFFQSQDDRSVKLAAFVYAFEHLEIAGYELLQRVAERADDVATVQLTHRILKDERAMAKRVYAAFDRAFEASLAD